MAKNKHETPSSNSIQHIVPVVAVLGHVDHGKTTLLDAIRKTSIAQREHGGITQKIGASGIEVVYDNHTRRITFIDTPGHEAFMHMRGRGALASDLALLIVSAVDGVMPQTKESIRLLHETKLPFIVVLTKADIPDRNPQMVKQQLAKEQVLVEGFGGEIPVIEVSAKTGENIKELLDLILLVWDVTCETVSKQHSQPFKGIIIESRLDTKIGPRATLIVKSGMLKITDEIIAQHIAGKVRAFITDLGAHVSEVGVGDAVEILGFEKVPAVGSIVQKKSEAQVQSPLEEKQKPSGQFPQQLPDGTLSVILCCDTQGSLEAVENALPPEINLIQRKTGEITEGDVLLARSTQAILIGFNAKVRPEIERLALTEKILLKNYHLIYELLQELQDVIEGKKLAAVEQVFGKAKILATFPFEKQMVLGISVLEGRVAKGDKLRIMHGEEIKGESHIVSLRRGKETTSKVEAGNEAGIIIAPALDFTIGDMVISHG